MTKINPEDWFKIPKKKKQKVKREPLTAASLERVLNLENKKELRWTQNNLYIGQIGNLENDEEITKALIEFWRPSYREVDYKSEFYMDLGSQIGNVLAERLHRVPGLTYCKSMKHEEMRVKNPEYGYSGRIDAIIDVNLFTYLGKKTRPKEEPEEKLFRPFEIKSTGQRNFDNWKTSKELSFKYKVQLELYLRELFANNLTKDLTGYFLLQSRDAPNCKRLMVYEAQDLVYNRAKEVCLKFWHHVQERNFPSETEHTKAWIEDQIADQEDRRWNKLANI